MAAVMSRGTTVCRHGLQTLLGRLTQPTLLSRVTPVTKTQVAFLRATYGEKYPYAKPFPYETKSYNNLTEWLDGTAHRMNENSKIIVVEGNVAVGKNEFAKRLATMFDMKYMPSVDEKYCFMMYDNGFDCRSLNQFLPKNCQFYDLKAWLSDPRPEVAKLEIEWFQQRVAAYCKAMLHVLSTGQGVVIAHSAFGQTGYVEAQRRLGYITKNFWKFFCEVREDVLVEMFRPHIMVYLEAPTKVIMDRIKKRNMPDEINSKVLNPEFITEVNQSFKDVCLPLVRKTTEVLVVDWSTVMDDLDMEALAEEMTGLKLEAEDREDPKFGDWYKVSEDEFAMQRKQLPREYYQRWLFRHQSPTNVPELVLPDDADFDYYTNIVAQHPAVKYEAGWAPQLGHKTLFRL